MTNELEKQYFGRERIYTDVDYIDEKNIFNVIQKAMRVHQNNVAHIDFLLKYEGGDQPLKRKKEIRPEIDIKDTQNLAHYITDFKLSYNWGNPISFVKKDDKGENSKGMSIINAMLEDEGFNSKNQDLFRFIEITGIGYTYINNKRRAKDDKKSPAFDYVVVNPKYCFKVYKNDIAETPMLDVIFRTLENGTRIFSAYTRDRYYEIHDLQKVVNGTKKNFQEWGNRSGEKNALNMFPLVEWLRDSDRMGCFEKEIPAMDALNIKCSDFANDISQKVQDIKHANDVEFEKDGDGNVVKPKSGDMIQTFTSPNGRTPFIKAIDSSFDYSGTQDNITSDMENICVRCFVPLKQTTGGGSTGTAMGLSTGWQEAEAHANKQELIIKKSLIECMRLILKVCELVNYDKKVGELDIRDIEPHILRNKTYDLATKSNALATLLAHGIDLKSSLVITDISGDIAQVIKNSAKMVEAYQEKELTNSFEEKKAKEEKKHMQDSSDQVSQSPIIDGTNKPAIQPKPDNNQNK